MFNMAYQVNIKFSQGHLDAFCVCVCVCVCVGVWVCVCVCVFPRLTAVTAQDWNSLCWSKLLSDESDLKILW